MEEQKTAVIEKNIRKVDKILDQSPRRSVRNIAKRTKLSKTTVWRILRKELGKFPYRLSGSRCYRSRQLLIGKRALTLLSSFRGESNLIRTF